MSDENERSVASAGSVAGEPVAWAVLRVGGRWVSILDNAVQAETSRRSFDKMENWVHEIVPLYRSPALTDAERVAVEAAVGRSSRIGTEYAIIDAAVLRGFLERHRGVSE